MCERHFAHQQDVHSTVITSGESLERHDYCAECCPQDTSQEVFCSWIIKYNDPGVLEAERQEALSPLRRLFYDSAALPERSELACAYLAAQLLKRQKVFRQIKESEESDGVERVTLFLDRAGNRLIEARDLNFSYAELDEARLVLMERLQALEMPAPGESSEDSDEADEHVTTATN